MVIDDENIDNVFGEAPPRCRRHPPHGSRKPGWAVVVIDDVFVIDNAFAIDCIIVGSIVNRYKADVCASRTTRRSLTASLALFYINTRLMCAGGPRRAASS